MKVVHFPDQPRPGWGHPVVALGNFDGLHRGHQRLIDEVRRRARERAGTSVAMVFDPHPPRVVRPDRAPKLLMTLGQKLEAFERAGLDATVVVQFTPEFARWEPELFVETVLVDWLRVSEVCVGANFLFGRDRTGTFTLLKALGQDRGFRTDNIEPVFYKDFVVSSTRVRHLLEDGRVDEAGALLGHHYFIDGDVVHGDGRGRTLGYPTANIRTINELVPADGVYASVVIVEGRRHAAATSIGTRPTIGDGPRTIEAYLLDGTHDLYDRRVRLAFVERLRPELKFESLQALVAQMADDVVAVRRRFEAMAI
jgi:riboflavin kinase/FMN adenylyltransferase